MRPVALLLLCSACAGTTRHVQPYQEKHRTYQAPPEPAATAGKTAPGSLWREGRSSSMLFTDARALHENDLVVIRVEEIADARRNSNTDLTRTSKQDLQINAFLKRVSNNPLNLGINPGLSTSTDTAFNGDGQSARTEHLVATVPAIVKSVLPNGNLFVEGHRVVLVNDEEQHFYISGLVRPIDIEQDNSVKSSMVADAEIEFTGQGDLSDNQHQGWFSRHLGFLWPF
ncbi:MAG TPA: flagellar basal body L-ring protein FlgH [Myxococcales bacterium]|nr:flagellar basal body L-ring protein FlgH [Myxococcales bacterium]